MTCLLALTPTKPLPGSCLQTLASVYSHCLQPGSLILPCIGFCLEVVCSCWFLPRTCSHALASQPLDSTEMLFWFIHIPASPSMSGSLNGHWSWTGLTSKHPVLIFSMWFLLLWTQYICNHGMGISSARREGGC